MPHAVVVPTAPPADLVDELDGEPIAGFRPGELLPANLPAAERLGVGHRCETWLAWSAALWCPVVVKFPRPHQLTHPRARAALRREVAALAGNLHPALPRLHTDGTDADVPHVVFEFVDGAPLDLELADAGAMGVPDVTVLGVPLLAALRTIHQRGLAHIDVKPENLVLRDGRPVLIDCGSARPLGARQPAGLLIGTAGYAAPELEAGEPIDAAMDVYGVGVTMHEALTGFAAFDADLPAAARPEPASLPGGELGALVLRMLEPDPARRPTVDVALAELARMAAACGQPVRPALRPALRP